ncbi:MAG: tRNA uridine-5-carboxymethylaminomethyl(34) synthesis GTPase MnmE [Candidatus Omnitrophica bacterium]|jgi:tRNA modification GTPase|nr:tRNA uridine-5-carboxymethylaminomethyl(34) synthesis GTPase MnmE [Candidatus Omnitrophota bacterium]
MADIEKYFLEDTIAAVSTPPGQGGIGIIRLSGPLSIGIADRIFRGKKGLKLVDAPGYTMHYGRVYDANTVVDEVLISIMRRPFTYTREDIIEINCHGGPACLSRVLDLVLKNSARLALPGEFTKRAFLNGRIDLIQAEAVCDIIASSTRQGLDIAQRQLGGEASSKIRSAGQFILDAAACLEADVNFPEEEIPASSFDSAACFLKNAEVILSELINASGKGVIFREGACCVICGIPNAGKSSLMNCLLGHDRVIVTDAAGTTRDSIEETLNIAGIPLRIIDTAGITESDDKIMRAGIERSKRCIDGADIILLVIDRSRPLSYEDICLIERVKKKKVIVVLSKSDLPPALSPEDCIRYLDKEAVLEVSVKDKTGLDRLEDAVYKALLGSEISVENIFLSNSRHIECAKKALDFIVSAKRGFDEKRPADIILIDIKDAAGSLTSITGEVFTDGTLERIFGRFCVGK